jgi:hypothetical protein
MHVPVLNGHSGVNTDETDSFTVIVLSPRIRYMSESLPECLERHHFRGSADCFPTHTPRPREDWWLCVYQRRAWRLVGDICHSTDLALSAIDLLIYVKYVPNI